MPNRFPPSLHIASFSLLQYLPLGIAAACGHIQIIQKLLDAGATANDCTKVMTME